MKNKFFKVTATASLLFVTAGLTPVSAAEQPGDYSLSVFHTNDTHAHLGTTPERAALVKKLRAENPANLLLDAGDVFSGSLYFNEFKGQADLAVMNYLEYDAMVFGNHEFDLGGSEEGHKALADFVKGAKFPLLGTNTDFSKDVLFDGLQSKTIVDQHEDGHIYDGIIKEVNGEKIGIFGLTTEETKDISSPDKITFTNYINDAKRAVAAFESMGINKIVAVTHIGFNDSDKIDNDILLAEGVPGIDIIVGGHTHAKLDEPFVVNKDTEPVVIVQANEYNKFLGQLDIVFNDDGVIKDYSGVLHAVGGKDAPRDEFAAELIKPYADQVKETMERSTGATADVFLSGLRGLGGVRTAETNLGNIITDGMLKTAQNVDASTVIAFQNGGGIRTSIPKGPITYGQAIGVLPFGNSLALVELSGKEIKAVFEHSVRDYPAESGGFLHVAGMKLLFDGEAEPGNRVVSMTIDGKEIEMDKTYKTATNVFTAKGGDGYEMLKTAYEEGRVSEPGFIDWESFANQMASIGSVKTGLENRIVATVPFNDIKTSDWSYQSVSDLYYREILKGTTATTYSPKRHLTRVQAASLIVRALDLKTDSPTTFKDMDGYAEATKAEIAAAHEFGIVNGQNGNFSPSDKVTRAQLALMIQRAIEQYTGENYTAKEKAPYADFGGYGDEAVNAISTLYELGIASGFEGNYMPTNSTTREHAAKVLTNFIYNTKQMKKVE